MDDEGDDVTNMTQRDKFLAMTEDAQSKLIDHIAMVRRNALRRVLADARAAGVTELARDIADRRVKELAAAWSKDDGVLKGHAADTEMFSRLATMYGVAAIGDILEASWRSH